MEQREQAPDAAPAPAVLPYGTHDRTGPWWRRWARAWLRAARPAAIAAVIVAALAYAVAPREYTAVTTVDVEPDLPSVMRGTPISPGMDFARADILARSLKKTDRLHAVLNSPHWQSARKRNPGKTRFDPIKAEAIAGTKTVRIRFTDPNREMARVGADAVVATITDRSAPGVTGLAGGIEKRLALLLERERDARERLAVAREGQPPLSTPSTPLTTSTPSMPLTRATTAPARLSNRDREIMMLERQLTSVSRMIEATERQLASIPRVQVASPAQTPRFPSNPKELLTWTLCAAGLAFPLVFLCALYGHWRYGRAVTVRLTTDRITSVTDLVSILGGIQRRGWRPAARRAVQPALVAALAAGVLAAWFAPRRYTASVVLTPQTAGAGAPTTAPEGVTPADVHAAFAAAAMSSQALDQVLKSPQWAAVRGGVNDQPYQPARVDAVGDGQRVLIRFTDADRDAARYGADAIVPAARAAVAVVPHDVQRELMEVRRSQLLAMRQQRPAATRQAGNVGASPLTTQPALPVLLPSSSLVGLQRDASPEAARFYAMREATTPARLSATPATVAWWPSNYGALAAAAGGAGAQALAVVFLLALLWFRRRPAIPAAGDALGAPAAMEPTRPPFQLAAGAAMLVGLIGYAVTPRTYTTTATLRVRSVEAGAMPTTMPSQAFVKRMGVEASRIVPPADVRTDPDAGTISIRYTAPDPGAARASANAIASSLAGMWPKAADDQSLRMLLARGERSPSPLLSAAGSQDPRIVRAIDALVTAGAGQRVEVALPAPLPRWANQLAPLKTAALAAVCGFVAVLFGIELLRDRRRSVKVVRREPAAAS